jgi:hypothetical protein
MAKDCQLPTDVYTLKSHDICLYQKWINISCINYNSFPRTCIVYIAEKVSDAKSHEEGPFISISDSISEFVRRLNLDMLRYIFEIKYQIQIF